jgi:hypothetical protein
MRRDWSLHRDQISCRCGRPSGAVGVSRERTRSRAVRDSVSRSEKSLALVPGTKPTEAEPLQDLSTTPQGSSSGQRYCDTNMDVTMMWTCHSPACGAWGRSTRLHHHRCMRLRRRWPIRSSVRPLESRLRDRDGTRASRRQTAAAEVVSSASTRTLPHQHKDIRWESFRRLSYPRDSKGTISAFVHDSSRRLVGAEVDESRMPEGPAVCPLGERDLGHQRGFHPDDRRHVLGGNAFAPAPVFAVR